MTEEEYREAMVQEARLANLIELRRLAMDSAPVAAFFGRENLNRAIGRILH